MTDCPKCKRPNAMTVDGASSVRNPVTSPRGNCWTTDGRTCLLAQIEWLTDDNARLRAELAVRGKTA